MASERRHVTRCWVGRDRQPRGTQPPRPKDESRRLQPTTAGRKPTVWGYTSADIAREAGLAKLASLSRAARQNKIDLANPFQALGLIAWSRRKELAYAGADVAALISGLATLDERSSVGWPIAARVRPAASPLRRLAERATSVSRTVKRKRDDDLYLPRAHHGRA